MSRVIAFVGPTLRRDCIPEHVMVRPPAAQGDVVAAAHAWPGATLVLIDGYFRQTLAPWHKEILYAMQVAGCRVIGAGSLGAIRAVECAPWGTEPVGVIAGWYRDGVCVDDGDVALAHGPEADGYPALSVPMVNLRASGCTALETLEKIPYHDRTWGAIAGTLGDDEAVALRAAYVDQKRLDALEALRVALAPAAGGEVRLARNLDSDLFAGMVMNDMPMGNGARPYEGVSLEERLAGSREELLGRLADALGVVPGEQELARVAQRIWDRLGVPDEEGSMRWLSERGLSLEQWWARVGLEARIDGLLLWLDVCESGLQSVPRAILRRNFYNK